MCVPFWRCQWRFVITIYRVTRHPLWSLSSSCLPCSYIHRVLVDITSGYFFRQLSVPPPYTLTEQHVAHPSIDSRATTRVNTQVHHASFFPTVPSGTSQHRYNLKSRGRGYPLITVASHVPNIQGSLLYFGEELKGFVALSFNDLNDVQSAGFVVSQFPKWSNRA